MDAPTITEREASIRQQAAFVAGAEWRIVNIGSAQVEATLRYPLPTIIRPRILTADSGFKWKVQDGSLWYCPPGDTLWYKHQSFSLAGITDLLANPTETVEP